MNKAELKKFFKEHNLQAKERRAEYKSGRPKFKARAKAIIKGIGNGIKNIGTNTKKRIKDFINTRQNYIELKKKWNYLVSSITVLGAAGSDKDVRKEIDEIVDFLNNEPELAKEKLNLIE